MTYIELIQIDESFVKIVSDIGILREIQDAFKFRVEGYQFQPAFRAGAWDGYIRFLNSKNGFFPKGLVPDLLEWCDEQKYKVVLPKEYIRFTERLDFDYKTLNLPFEPHDYQLEAVDLILDKKRRIILASTGAGKSLIIYMICRAMLEADYRVLVIVPTISLVSQLYSDFDDYAVNDNFASEKYVHQICEGAKKTTDKPIIISTWQSLQRATVDYMSQFDCVIVDEVHTARATVLKELMQKCTRAFYRCGLTGTLDDILTNELTIKSSFGPIKRVTDTKDLQDRGILSQIEINGIILKYPEHVRRQLQGLPFQQELDFIVRNEKRNNLISKFTSTLNGNTLVLFQFVEKHGKILEKKLREYAAATGKEVHFIYGGVDSEQREAVRKLAEKKDGMIICASVQVFQAGVNIKNLHNVVFASSYKSKIRIFQSIGRGLRKHESKDKMRLYDFTDDFTVGKKKNYTYKHFIERVNMYVNQQFPVKIIEIEL